VLGRYEVFFKGMLIVLLELNLNSRCLINLPTSQSSEGNILPGALLLGPIDPRSFSRTVASDLGVVPVLSKVQ
jgi:hypothetical protein